MIKNIILQEGEFKVEVRILKNFQKNQFVVFDMEKYDEIHEQALVGKMIKSIQLNNETGEVKIIFY